MSLSQTLQQSDYYTVLGADPMARLDEIEALFRELAMEAETTGDHAKVPQAVEAFKVLRDPQMRQQYDQFLNQQRAQLHQQQMAQAAEAQALQTQQQQQTQITQQAQPQAHTTQSEQPAETPTYQQQVPTPQAEPQQPTAQFTQPVEELPIPTDASMVNPPPMIPTLEDQVVETTVQPVEEPVLEEPAVADPAVAEAQVQTAEQKAASPPEQSKFTPENKSTATEELKFKPDVLDRHRRELMRMFYEKRRADMRRAGIAIGGLDTVVNYSYELLEFHLWILAEKKWIVREESGALEISALGCENHENNLTAGLITSSLE